MCPKCHFSPILTNARGRNQKLTSNKNKFNYLEDFESIYDAHRLLVYNVALHYCQNISDAEEITQDVFVKYFQGNSGFRNEAKLSTWFYRVTINTSIDLLRKKKRRSYLTLFGNTDSPQLSDFNHPGVQLESKEHMEQLFHGINQLPNNQKTAIILTKLEQVSQEEAAQIMKTTRKSIESLVQRGKKNLENYLSSEG